MATTKPATPDTTAAAPAAGKPRFQKVKTITLPVLKLEFNAETYVYAHGPMYLGEKVEKDKAEAVLMHAFDMESGEEGLIVVPTVMMRELIKNYGATGYVGKGFCVVKTKAPEDSKKKYNHISMDEVGVPDDFKRPASPPSIGGPGAVEAVMALYEKARKEQAGEGSK